MFIAHLPAGYLLGSALQSLNTRGAMSAALLGSIFPDLDLFYFYLIDNRQHNHHSYWIHYPVVWITLLALSAAWFLLSSRKSRTALLAVIFSTGGLLHLFLDAFVGDLMLFAPFSREYFNIIPVRIEAVHQPWWLNFILHWSFLIELAIVVAAITVIARNIRRRKSMRDR